MHIRTSQNSDQTYQVAAGQSSGLEGEAKGEVEERPENHRGCGLGAESRSDHGGDELCFCTERKWHCGKAALKSDRNLLTGNTRVAGT